MVGCESIHIDAAALRKAHIKSLKSLILLNDGGAKVYITDKGNLQI